MAAVNVCVGPVKPIAIDELKVGQYARVVDKTSEGRYFYFGMVVLCVENGYKGRAVTLDGRDTAWSWSRESEDDVDHGCPLEVEVLPPGTVITITV